LANASCESFMKTLKREEVYCRDYQDYEDLSQHLEAFIDQYYNRQRLHSALGYRAPGISRPPRRGRMRPER